MDTLKIIMGKIDGEKKRVLVLNFEFMVDSKDNVYLSGCNELLLIKPFICRKITLKTEEDIDFAKKLDFRP